MANLPDSLFGEPTTAPAPEPIASHPPHTDLTNVPVDELILALNHARTRERALHLLSQKRSMFDNLAVLIWHSFGTMFTLLKEIMDVYHLLSKPELTEKASTRVCNALALLQVNDKEVIYFLLKTEIVPYCLRCMDVGKGLSKTSITHHPKIIQVATFIVQKILMNEEGLRYCCIIADRFFAITRALETMMETLSEEPSQRLLKHIVRCYLMLSESPRACLGLGRLLPRMLSHSAFTDLLHDDPTVMSSFKQLLRKVHENRL
uniref:Cell differentiation protein rcd1 n=1 Tax=Cucumis melo TaxID=3656 RepID=A0A9I9DIH2_CUCME